MINLSEPTLYALLGALLTAFSFAVVRMSLVVWGQIKFARAYDKFPRVVAYNHNRACAGPHAWQPVTLAMRKMIPGKHQVCTKCGAIAGNLLDMLSKEAVDQLNEVLQRAVAKAENQRLVEERVQEVVDFEVARYVNLKFHREATDPTFLRAAMELVDFAVEIRKEAVRRIDLEKSLSNAEDELDSFGGNA